MYDKHYFDRGFGSNYKSGYKAKEKSNVKYFHFVRRKAGSLTGKKILDIGCAYGYFLKHCWDSGARVYGMDNSLHAVKIAKRLLPEGKILSGNAENKLPFKYNYFDIVVAFDLIEHLTSPYKFLTETSRILKKDGLLFIATPNADALQKILLKEKWHGFVDMGHKYLMSPLSLKFLVKRAGFREIIINTPFYPLGRFSKILEWTGRGGQIWLEGRK